MNSPNKFMHRTLFAPREMSVSTLDLGKIITVLWRGRWLIAATTLIVTLLGAIWILQQKPTFRAAAEILLDSRKSNALAIERVVSDLPANDAVIASEIGVIKSRRVLNKVIDELNLANGPEFNPRKRQPYIPLLDRLTGWLPQELASDLREFIGPSTHPELADLRDDTASRAIYNELLKKLTVRQLGISYIIEVRASSKSPRRAAQIANAVAEAYIANQLEVKFEEAKSASNWLSERVENLRSDVVVAEAAIETARAERLGENLSGQEVTEQQLAQLNAQLVEARGERAAAAAALGESEGLVNRNGLAEIAGILDTNMVVSLKTDLAGFRVQFAEWAQRYGPKHPKMIDLARQIEATETAIEREARRYMTSLRKDHAVAKAREQALSDSLAELEGRTVELAKSSVGLRELEREAEASRFLYENFLGRLKETAEQVTFQDSDSRIISIAEPPGVAATPRKRRLLAMFILAGIAMGLLVVLSKEALRTGIRTAEELEQAVGERVLGAIPRSGSWLGRIAFGPVRAVLRCFRREPEGKLAEALRGIAVRLWPPRQGGSGRAVLVTSSSSGEGKTTTSLMLAQAAARLEYKTIAVECDLRRPGFGRALGRRRIPGLGDVLSGDCPLEGVLHRDELSGIWVLPAGVVSASPIDALYSRRFRDIIEQLKQTFDVIILDSPPMHETVDAEILAQYADAALYLVSWSRKPAAEVQAGVARLAMSGTEICGTALTMVPAREATSYGYPSANSVPGELRA